MDLTDHFLIILKNWWKILAVAIAAALVVGIMVNRQAPTYESDTTLSVTPGGSLSSNAQEATLFLTRTYAELASSRPVVERAITDEKLDISVESALGSVSASAAQDVGFLTITASGATPRGAAALANAIAKALIEEVDRRETEAVTKDLESVNAEIATIEQQLKDAGSVEDASLRARYDALLQVAVERRASPHDRLDVLAAAQPVPGPVSPHPRRDGALAFIAAAILAAEASVALSMLSQRLPGEDLEALSRITGLPVLAVVPRGDTESIAEAYRSLRTNLRLTNNLVQPHTTAIVSATPRVGKSFTAINFAESMARQGEGDEVLLIDADCRRPVLHTRLQVPRAPGLSEVLHGADVKRSIYKTNDSSTSSFFVMPSGQPSEDPVALLSGQSFITLLSNLADAGHLLVVDTPPVEFFTDAVVVAAMCDVTVLVIDAKSSRKRPVLRTISTLQRSGATIAGIVVNRARADRGGARYYESVRGPQPPQRQITR